LRKTKHGSSRMPFVDCRSGRPVVLSQTPKRERSKSHCLKSFLMLKR